MAVDDTTINNFAELSRMLGEYGEIRRATLMPNGAQESDSHHAFELALIAHELAAAYAPHLNSYKILLYSLVHDLPEVVTGDTNTLMFDAAQHSTKASRDLIAFEAVATKLTAFPALQGALQAYEAQADEEAHFVYWADKAMPGLHHFYDDGTRLRELGITTQADIDLWYANIQQKLEPHASVHESAKLMLEGVYLKMRNEVLVD